MRRRAARTGTSWSVGVLAALLLSFENRDGSVISGARFEEEGGEPVLVVAGGVGADLRFRGGIAGSSVGDPESAGFIRLRPALATLVRNKWFTCQVKPGETRIGLGERAKKTRGQAA